MTFDYLPLSLMPREDNDRAGVDDGARFMPSMPRAAKYLSAALLAALFALALASLAATAPAIAGTPAQVSASQGPVMTNEAAKHFHDFDYLVGKWTVTHHKLKARLANSHDWVDFTGKSDLKLILNGYGTFDENEIDQPEGAYKGVTIRTFDPKTGLWSVYWLDSRFPGVMDNTPLKGNFDGDVGTFYADDTFNGKPIRVRFSWKFERPNNAHWEQAFSPDGGKNWETNWTMEFTRAE